MENHPKPAGYSCKSCTRPDTDDEKWVACGACKLWEHYGCAGVDDSVKSLAYFCNECRMKNPSLSTHYLKPPSSSRTLRSSSAKSGSKKLEKTASIIPSSTSSARAARLQVEMKLLEEERIMQEQTLEAQKALERKTTEEALRRLEEKKALMEEEANIRQRQLQEEKAFQEKQQQIRQESLEKMQSIIRQMSECGSRAGSIHDSNQKVSDWLNEIHSDVFDTESESGKADPLTELNPPVPVTHHSNPDCANPPDQPPISSNPPGLPNPTDQAPIPSGPSGLPPTPPSIPIPSGQPPIPSGPLNNPIPSGQPGLPKPSGQKPVPLRVPIPSGPLNNPIPSGQPGLPKPSGQKPVPLRVPIPTEPPKNPIPSGQPPIPSGQPGLPKLSGQQPILPGVPIPSGPLNNPIPSGQPPIPSDQPGLPTPSGQQPVPLRVPIPSGPLNHPIPSGQPPIPSGQPGLPKPSVQQPVPLRVPIPSGPLNHPIPSGQPPIPSGQPGLPKPSVQQPVPLRVPIPSGPLNHPIPSGQPPIPSGQPGLPKPSGQQPVPLRFPIPSEPRKNPIPSGQPPIPSGQPGLPTPSQRHPVPPSVSNPSEPSRFPQSSEQPLPPGIPIPWYPPGIPFPMGHFPMPWWPPGFPMPFGQHPVPIPPGLPRDPGPNDQLPIPPGPPKNPVPTGPSPIPREPPRGATPTDHSSLPSSVPTSPTPSVPSPIPFNPPGSPTPSESESIPLDPPVPPCPLIPPPTPSFPRPDRLDASQMAARQVMGKELPHFSGNPEDWPIFICSFEQTTAACGYSDTENLIRLQRCLKGHALESVRSRLLLPSSVPQVINTLRTLYGRPELLIRSLIEKVHRAPAPKHDRLETVMEFGLTVQNLVEHLKSANQFLHLANPVLMQELVEKLPGSLKMEWAVYKSKQPDATLATFGDFMGGLVTAASQVTYDLPGSSRNFKSDQKRSKEKGIVQTHSPLPASAPIVNQTASKKPGKPCAICDREGHRVVECDKFKSYNVDERWKAVHQKALCRTCLNSHGKWPCKSWKGCGIEGCLQKHNTLLHSSFSSQPSPKMSANHLTQGNGLFPMFRVLPVVLYAGERSEVVFAFIDEGSSITLLDESIAERLGVTGPPEPLTLQWTGKVTREEPRSQRVQLDVSAKRNGNRHKLSHVRTVSSLVLPSQTLKYRELCQRYPHLRGLPLEDYDLVQPKLLIGLDNLRLGVPLKLREGGAMDPIAAKCRLGWSVYGCVAGLSSQRAVVNFHLAGLTNPDQQLNEQLRDFITLDDAGVTGHYEPLESNEDIRARRILEETTRRTDRGFETGLLFRHDNPDFPDSYQMAVRRLLSLERKLAKDSSLQIRVREQIAAYLQKGYAHKATEAELANADKKRMWFLPLGVTINPKKPDKIRLIWDAAAVANGVSLNSKLLKGPDLLSPLPGVLSRFRQFPVAVCGDIKEMFHQLLIRIQDRLAQCFLWRDYPSDPIQVYIMDVATFGATCSPASAQYVKNLNAQEFAELYPRATAAIVKNHYVDDYLDSFMTVEEAVEVVKEVILVHEKGGFEICKFRSNSTQLLREIGEIPADKPKNLALEREGTTESVLGMKWLPEEDCFTYTVNLREDLRTIADAAHVPTKREVLKVVMSLFDPLGLIAHFLVHGKVIIQGTWASGTAWDEPINEDLHQKWRQWVELFPKLDRLMIPRCYFAPFPDTLDELQVHTFVDASDTAYSCAVYFRVVNSGIAQLILVGAKSKVAPLKTLSIPRLELKAAVLGVRFLTTTLEYHTLSIAQRFFWSDSTTVLAWIRSDHRRFHKFVSVRIGEILTLSEPHEWRWVQSKNNVADDATKWKSGPNLDSDSPWLQGPKFLHYGEQSWPKQTTTETIHEEIRRVQAHWNASPLIDYSRFSRWEKLQRTTAYVIRFIDSSRRRNVGQQLQAKVLTQAELEKAEVLLWRMAQEEAFPDERNVLKATQGTLENRHPTVSKSSPIYKTWPYMDEQGTLRMRGRIEAAAYAPFEAKYPAILPKHHPVTVLITDFYHRRYRHANRETVVNEMRQRFEVANLRSLIRKVADNCVFCKISKTVPTAPPMAPHSEERLEPFVRPFTYVGVDYFGPVLVKVGRSQVKRWIALFTCLTVRAVHMEVVYSLSTDSCVMAVRRFICRRGSPAVFYSDNGTCFQGASRQLREEIAALNDAMATTFTNARTAWKFIPPAAPHMGGVWERLVRSVKVAIGSALDTQRKPDDETLKTIIYEAEALVNSRPLTYVPLESADQESLTPNHFLLGSSTGDKLQPAADVSGYAALRSNWKQAQFITGEFWRRWIREYLPVITRRCKWFENVKELEVGDLVLVVNGTGRNQWIRGRVERVVPGRDGRVRQALVRTATGVLRRPAIKLAVLDVGEQCKPVESSGDLGHLGLRAGVCDDQAPRCGDAVDIDRHAFQQAASNRAVVADK